METVLVENLRTEVKSLGEMSKSPLLLRRQWRTLDMWKQNRRDFIQGEPKSTGEENRHVVKDQVPETPTVSDRIQVHPPTRVIRTWEGKESRSIFLRELKPDKVTRPNTWGHSRAKDTHGQATALDCAFLRGTLQNLTYIHRFTVSEIKINK